MTDASAAHEPEGSSEVRPEPQPPEPAALPAPPASDPNLASVETGLSPSAVPEVQPLELPPAQPAAPIFAEPTPAATQAAGALRSESPASTPSPTKERAEEVEAIPLSAREARILSAEAPQAQGATVSPATPPPFPSTPSTSATGTDAASTAAGTSLPPPPAPAGAPSAWRRRRQHLWAILCHLFLFLTIPTVFLGATLTFLVWQLKGKHSREVEEHGREALNFQINVAVLTLLLGVTCLGAPLIPIVWLVAAIFAVLAARAASDGDAYRYPYVLRIVTH